MSKIALTIEEIELGYLSEHNGKYLFCANGNEVDRARTKYPLDMMLFNLNATGMSVYDAIPYPFNTFLAGTNRPDLMEKAGIADMDTDFVKLYKLSALNLVRENFEIHKVD